MRGADSGAVRTATYDGEFTHNTGNTFTKLNGSDGTFSVPRPSSHTADTGCGAFKINITHRVNEINLQCNIGWDLVW